MKTVAIIGALTAIFAATIGLVQNDIKRVLAYSTVSQLGYMFLALGVGAFAAGVFHVFTHAFFKALLFLGAGSVIHAMSGEQDMRNMGDAAQARFPSPSHHADRDAGHRGIPPFAGFFSKDAILWETWSREGGAYRYLWYIAFATALMTAFYMFRLIYLTFFGKPRMSHEVEHHIHESPKSMTVPLVILAICSIWRRMAGMAAQPRRIRPLREIPRAGVRREAQVLVERRQGRAARRRREKEEEHTIRWNMLLMFLSRGAQRWAGGWLGAPTRMPTRATSEPIAVAAPPVYKTLLNKYYVDEGYDYVFTGRRKGGRRAPRRAGFRRSVVRGSTRM
jgi:NADH-quinone oxidoreductase subunit L